MMTIIIITGIYQSGRTRSLIGPKFPNDIHGILLATTRPRAIVTGLSPKQNYICEGHWSEGIWSLTMLETRANCGGATALINATASPCNRPWRPVGL
jgi:hypothetical protein